jgi:hypothetical protein
MSHDPLEGVRPGDIDSRAPVPGPDSRAPGRSRTMAVLLIVGLFFAIAIGAATYFAPAPKLAAQPQPQPTPTGSPSTDATPPPPPAPPSSDSGAMVHEPAAVATPAPSSHGKTE